MSAWDNPAEMLARAQAARAQGDRDLAYQLYARASELNPQDAHAWQGRAETATNSDEALVSYAYAAALTPEDQPLARTLDASIAHRITDSAKGDVPLLLALGQELAEVGLTERAGPFFQRAADLDRSSTDALVWLAGLEQDKEKQTDYLNRALATNPRDARARAGLLAVRPPSSPPPAAVQTSSASRLAASTAASSVIANASTAERAQNQAAAANASSQLEPSMERLRRLRASMPTEPPSRPAPAPVAQMQASAPTNDKWLRIVLLVLLGLVVVFAFAGIFLLLNK
ncbi:MAG: hypothetical protein HY741_24425 [Chloroflexi bacterium]|nr:hypothetical protein [Chloroflexota bacterium]